MGDKTRQNKTRKKKGATLSSAQEKVVEELLSGSTISRAAKVAGVHRSSVHRWMTEDFLFQAELNRKRMEIRQAMNISLLRVRSRALATVEGAIDDGDVRAALIALKSDLEAPAGWIGSTDPQELERAAQNREKEAEIYKKERDFPMMLRGVGVF